MNLRELGLEIADCGGWEEYFQRCGRDPNSINYYSAYTMQDHFKSRRLRLEAEYRRRKARGE